MCSLLSCSNESNVEDSSPKQSVESKEIKIKSNPYLYDEIYEIRDGKEIDLTNTQLQTRSTHEFYEVSTILPRYIFLGSVITEQSINQGRYKPVGSIREWKKDITISFSLPVKSATIKPSKSALQDAIVEAVQERNFSGRQSQVFSYKMKQFSYYKELKLAFGANVNVGKFFNVDMAVNEGKTTSTTGLFIDFSQTYFSVDMDFPDDGNIFRSENIRQKYESLNPVYVGSVNYGRKGIILVESSSSYNELSVAVRTAFKAKVVNGELSLDTKTKEILNNSKIQICIIGGEGDEATKTIEGFHKFQEYIVKGGVYTKEIYGVPISFSGSYASDNSMFVSEFDL